jgi:hypothetical protein
VIDTPPPPSGVPLVEMIRTILDAGLRVLRGEMSLTRAEIVLALRIAARGLAMIAVAVVAAVLGLVLLAQAAVAGLVALGLAPGWAGADRGCRAAASGRGPVPLRMPAAAGAADTARAIPAPPA